VKKLLNGEFPYRQGKIISKLETKKEMKPGSPPDSNLIGKKSVGKRIFDVG